MADAILDAFMSASRRGDEDAFRKWYGERAKKTGLAADPDDPRHKYDYRAAFRAGAEPELANDGAYHWPSQFKADDHPNRFVDGVDTKEGDDPLLSAFFSATAPKSPAEAARERLKGRGINPDIPVDQQGPKRKSAFRQFQDSLQEVAQGQGPNPFQYALAAAKGAVGVIPQLPVGDASTIIPGVAGGMEGMNMARRINEAQTEFPDDPWRRRLMTAAGAVPMFGEAMQGAMKPSMVASDRMPTDEERLAAMEGTFTLGSLAAAKAKGIAPGGGDISGLDLTKGVRQHLSEKTAPQIGRNLLKPKNSQMQFGADPGEFVTGMKTTAGEGIESYGPQIDAKLKALNAQADQVAFNTTEGRSVPIDYEGALRKGFQKHIAEAIRDNDGMMATRLQGVLEREIEALHKVTGGSGKAPARIGRRYQQDLGAQVGRFQKAGKAGVADPADGTIRMARQDAWVDIKEQTSKAVPGLRDVNEQLHSGIEAKKALIERELVESRADPLPWFRHPIAATVGAIPNAVGSPWFRSRLAAGLRGLSPLEEAAGPTLLPNEAAPWRPGVRRPANEQRALPQAPENAPEGFISSDDLRRVGTRMGQLPEQDAAVFAPQNRTGGMMPPEMSAREMSPDAPWMEQIRARSGSNLYDMAAGSDFRDLSRTLGAVRDADYASGSPAGRVSPNLPDWLTSEPARIDPAQIRAAMLRPVVDAPPTQSAQPTPPASSMAADMAAEASRPAWMRARLDQTRAKQQALDRLSSVIRPQHRALTFGEILEMPQYQQVYQNYLREILAQGSRY